MTVDTAEPKRDPLGILTVAALVIALATVAARCTIMELNNAILDFGPDGDAGGIGPSTTMALDAICWLPALLIGIRRAIDPEYVLRWSKSHLVLLALVIWVTASAFWASNKFDALLGAGTWWSAAALLWAASQLVRSWTRWRPVLGLAVGLLMVFVAQAVIYRYVEMPETQAYWKSVREDVMARSGRDASDFTMRRYDQMVNSGQLQGFFRSPNTFAAIAALTAFAAAGLAWQRFRDKDEPVFVVLAAVPAVALPIIIYWTGSRTAGGLAALTLLGLLIAWQAREWLAKKSAAGYGIGVGVALLGVATILAVGLSTDGLIQKSLSYRWYYWTASWDMFLAKPLLGVGWTNFGNTYLGYRLPIASEEIKDPHNLLVRFATEAGAVGAVLFLAWIALALREVTRPVLPRTPAASPLAVSHNPLRMILAVVALFWLMRTVLLFPTTVLFLEATKTALFAVLLLGGFLVTMIRSTKGTPAGDERPAPFTLYAVVAGLLGFLAHNGLDFPMGEVGPLLLFALIIGALLGLRHPSVAGKKTHTIAAIAGLGVTFLLLLAALGLWAVPVWNAESKIAAADVAGKKERFDDAMRLGREAIVASPVPNPDYIERTLRWGRETPPNEISALLGQVIAADPADPQGWLNRARYEARTNASQVATMSDFATAIKKNPNDVNFRLEYADYLDSIGERDKAAEQVQAALAANDGLAKEEPRRLPEDRVEALKRRIGK